MALPADANDLSFGIDDGLINQIDITLFQKAVRLAQHEPLSIADIWLVGTVNAIDHVKEILLFHFWKGLSNGFSNQFARADQTVECIIGLFNDMMGSRCEKHK